MPLIIFEGGEGVGKTTQISLVHNLLNRNNLAVLQTREPGGTPLAEKIRNLFKETTESTPLPLTEIYLLSAARNEHVKTVLIPELKNNKIILCDRFLDSTYVYQCVVGGVSKTLVDQISKPVIGDIFPDLTFIFYCNESTARKRIRNEESRKKDRYDAADVSLHEKILKGYKTIYDEKFAYPNNQVPNRVLIDASQSIHDTFLIVIESIQNYCNIKLKL